MYKGAQIVYLDQNHWSNLVKAELGHPALTSLKPVLEFVRNIVKEGRVIFPYSSLHLMETISYDDKNKRKKLADLLEEISQRICLKPFDVITRMEIEDSIKKFLGISEAEKIIKPFCEDILSCWGTQINWEFLKGKLSDEQIEVYKHESNKWSRKLSLFESIEFLEPSKCKTSREYENFFVNFTQKIKEWIKRGKPSKEQVIKDTFIDLKREFCDKIVFKILFEINKRYDIKKHCGDLFSIEFIKKTPTFYNWAMLSSAELLKVDRPPDRNDIIDMAHISCAITYCDIIVTERFWGSICNELKFPDKYSHIVIEKIKDLKNILADNKDT